MSPAQRVLRGAGARASRIACRAGLAALVLAALLAVPPVRAGELVQVAAHRADPRHPDTAPPLYGFLTHPPGRGPFPAVVVLHGCAGFGQPDIAAAERLRAAGYLALALDSLGGTDACRMPGGAPAEARDAGAALRMLAARPDVAAGRIAVLGFSMGGFAVLDLVTQGGGAPAAGPRFRAAVAFYPNCRFSTGVMTTPLLILMGSADDWTPVAACRAILDRRAGRGAKVRLVVYPGATHAFDVPARAHTILGHHIRYDAAAARAAWGQVRAFLAAAFAQALPPALPGGRVAPK
ncbi:MAG: hypothetical protein HIU82_18455 [Proteobacteria bacterium]|nr:hypothetical protein [Pseudomonadota bacterium]